MVSKKNDFADWTSKSGIDNHSQSLWGKGWQVYICICNAMTDREVRAAIDAGASNWHEVHSHYGHEPNCGRCECDILDQISRCRGPVISQPLSGKSQVTLSGGD